jgi:hypothetical protein
VLESFGHETGRRPLGLTLPKSASATAAPPSLPGRKAIRLALDSSSWRSIFSGRPATTTTTTGLPVAFSASISAACASGRAGVASSPCPSAYGLSPTATTIASASLAAATASARCAATVALAGSLSGSGGWARLGLVVPSGLTRFVVSATGAFHRPIRTHVRA